VREPGRHCQQHLLGAKRGQRPCSITAHDIDVPTCQPHRLHFLANGGSSSIQAAMQSLYERSHPAAQPHGGR
jgi:hypothetical protein